MKKLKTVELYTDGSCLGNPGPGGWAALLIFMGTRKLLTGSDGETTNNRMELMGVIGGLTGLKEPCNVRVHLDSQYVMNAFAKNWLTQWQRNGWRTASKQEVKNRDLWEDLLSLAEKHELEWNWVKGHSGNEMNELVDQAAVKAARTQTSSAEEILP